MGVFISFTLYLFVIPFSVGVFLFLFISFLFSIFSLLFLFYVGGSLVLVQVKQVRGVLQSFYYKKGGMGSLYTGEVIIKKRMSNNKVDKPGLQHHLAGQIQITRCFNGYLNDEWVRVQMT